MSTDKSSAGITYYPPGPPMMPLGYRVAQGPDGDRLMPMTLPIYSLSPASLPQCQSQPQLYLPNQMQTQTSATPPGQRSPMAEPAKPQEADADYRSTKNELENVKQFIRNLHNEINQLKVSSATLSHQVALHEAELRVRRQASHPSLPSASAAPSASEKKAPSPQSKSPKSAPLQQSYSPPPRPSHSMQPQMALPTPSSPAYAKDPAPLNHPTMMPMPMHMPMHMPVYLAQQQQSYPQAPSPAPVPAPASDALPTQTQTQSQSQSHANTAPLAPSTTSSFFPFNFLNPFSRPSTAPQLAQSQSATTAPQQSQALAPVQMMPQRGSVNSNQSTTPTPTASQVMTRPSLSYLPLPQFMSMLPPHLQHQQMMPLGPNGRTMKVLRGDWRDAVDDYLSSFLDQSKDEHIRITKEGMGTYNINGHNVTVTLVHPKPEAVVIFEGYKAALQEFITMVKAFEAENTAPGPSSPKAASPSSTPKAKTKRPSSASAASGVKAKTTAAKTARSGATSARSSTSTAASPKRAAASTTAKPKTSTKPKAVKVKKAVVAA